jgi:CarD family transcriptional regulator
MKTNTKKTIATKTKAPVKKSAVKVTKPVVKAPVKKDVKKSAAVKPAAKKISPAVKAKAVVKTTVKTPVKAVKSAPKATKAPVKAVKTPVKSVKVAPKTVKATKAPVKVAPKAVVAPVKAATPKAAPKAAPKAVPKAAIVVKMPENENTPAKPQIRATIIATARPAQMAMNKMSTHIASANAAQSNRPVYRPIQVINKPLTPLQPVRAMAPIAKDAEKVEFKKGDYVVYPAHGVGEIEAVETQIIGGMEIKLYAIAFEKDRMRLKVPVFKAHASGLRRLSTSNRMDDALKTLQGRAQIRRAMWSRRAQEYETKINSGDPVAIAEVLRDLKRSNDESEQSYSERQIYQSALERLAREVAAVEKITEIEAAERLENMIKSKRSRAASATGEEEVKEVANA